MAPTTAPAARDITAEGPHRRALHRAGRCADEDGDEDGADVMLRSGRGWRGGFQRFGAPPGDISMLPVLDALGIPAVPAAEPAPRRPG